MRNRKSKRLDEKTLQEIIRRVVEVACPEKIVLFGSAARDDMGPNSDVDLLVIVDNHMHRRRTAQAIYRQLLGVGFAADIVVVTKGDVEQHKDNPGLIIRSAIKEGKLAYAR